MIVVVGALALIPGPPASAAGRAAAIALAAVEAGARVEVMGRIGDDPDGDALLLALARSGVGHVAVLRDAGRPTRRQRVPGSGDDEPTRVELLNGDDHALEAGEGDPRLEPADVALGLRYLTAFDVLVVGDDAPEAVIPACVDAAEFAGARLVVAVRSAGTMPDGLPEDATVLVAPDEDGDAFPRLLGRYAAALDSGAVPGAAFAAAAGDGWERPGS